MEPVVQKQTTPIELPQYRTLRRLMPEVKVQVVEEDDNLTRGIDLKIVFTEPAIV